MSDPIDRQAALDALEKEKPTPFVNKDGSVDPFGAGRQNQRYRDGITIMNLPPADAVPVVHGTWKTVEDWDGDEHYQCSECGAEFVLIEGTPNDNDYLYCPHCGARMDGDHHEG